MVADSDQPRDDSDIRPDADEAAVPSETPTSDAPQASPGPSAPSSSEMQAQLEEANARALRYQAELENFRKRTRRELDEQLQYATLPLITDLLAVADNLQWALQAAEQHADNSGLLEGVKMVSRQLSDVLRQHGCVEIEAEGLPFDPHLHEAVAQEPSQQHPAGTVTRVHRGGYRLHDRVIRPAQVHVSSGQTQ